MGKSACQSVLGKTLKLQKLFLVHHCCLTVLEIALYVFIKMANGWWVLLIKKHYKKTVSLDLLSQYVVRRQFVQP